MISLPWPVIYPCCDGKRAATAHGLTSQSRAQTIATGGPDLDQDPCIAVRASLSHHVLNDQESSRRKAAKAVRFSRPAPGGGRTWPALWLPTRTVSRGLSFQGDASPREAVTLTRAQGLGLGIDSDLIAWHTGQSHSGGPVSSLPPGGGSLGAWARPKPKASLRPPKWGPGLRDSPRSLSPMGSVTRSDRRGYHA